jgi:hypothetical protein
VFVYKRIVLSLLVICIAPNCGFAQGARDAAVTPQIIIDLPDDVPPETVWVRYALYGPDGSGGRISQGERLKAEPNFRHYISAVFGGAPARYAKIVIYASGCKLAAYDLDLESGSDITEQFRCDSLPTRTVRGFIRPDKIPSNTYLAEKKLEIAAYEDGDWVCRFFFQPRPEATIIQGGSCLGSEIPLGTVGEIDPARSGNFEITIPDFTRDPVFDKFGEHGKFGVIDLALREKKIGRVLVTIKPEDGPERGLNVQDEYREPLTFTTGH